MAETEYNMVKQLPSIKKTIYSSKHNALIGR